MLNYLTHTLPNGLRVCVHRDTGSQLTAVHLLYHAGSKFDPVHRTGMAHLMEHLMFSGSLNVPDFDSIQQMAGGENNAYTNADVAHYYQILPTANLETAFFLEADRLFNLKVSEQKLKTQIKVVTEEWTETVRNETFGDVWHHLFPLMYKDGPYSWPIIGKSKEDIKSIDLEDAFQFYKGHYNPKNCVLSIAGPEDSETILKKAEVWFSGKNGIKQREWPAPKIYEATKLIYKELEAEAGVEGMFMAFHMPGRFENGYYACDLLSDILGHGNSSRLVEELMESVQIFSNIDCYINGNIDTGLIIIEGRPAEGVPIDNAVNAVWEQLAKIREEFVLDRELRKWKNKVNTTIEFSELGIHSKASNLGYFELYGDITLINRERELFEQVTREEILHWAQKVLVPENCGLIIYRG